jgi:hypothetical protein
MGFAINFCVGAIPDVLRGSKVAVLNLRDDGSTFLMVLHSAINRSTFLGLFEMLLTVFIIIQWFAAAEL